MAGFEGIGELLGDMVGGGQELRLAEAATQGRYRSAQTEQALANARKGQADAIRAEETNRIMAELLANAPNFDALTNVDKTRFMVGGIGDEFANVAQGDLRVQERQHRDKIAAPETSARDQQRYRAAVGDAPFNPVDAVGTRGAFSDARNPDAGVQKPIGEDMFPTDPTPQQKNFEYLEALPPEKQDRFGRVLRADQIVNTGGVPVARPTAGGAPKEVVPANQVAQNAGAIAQAKVEGTGMGKRTLDLPAAKGRIAASAAKTNLMTSAAQRLQQDEALWSAVGVGKPIASIPGTEGAKLRANINTLKAQVGFSVLQDMRDLSKTGGALGNVSNIELEFLQNAIASLDTQLAPEDFREQLQILIDYVQGSQARLNQAFMDTYSGQGGAAPASSGSIPTFATEAEAEAAGIKPGTRVVIGGVSGVWE